MVHPRKMYQLINQDEMPKNADTPSPFAYNPGKSETMQSPSWK